jgi:hypothetical protein
MPALWPYPCHIVSAAAAADPATIAAAAAAAMTPVTLDTLTQHTVKQSIPTT